MKVIRISAILICVILMSACENNMFSSGKSANEALESIKNKLKLIDDKITKDTLVEKVMEITGKPLIKISEMEYVVSECLSPYLKKHCVSTSYFYLRILVI